MTNKQKMAVLKKKQAQHKLKMKEARQQRATEKKKQRRDEEDGLDEYGEEEDESVGYGSVEVVENPRTTKYAQLRKEIELDESEDDHTIDPETGKKAEEVSNGAKKTTKDDDPVPPVVEHPVTPTPKKRKQPTPNSPSWEYPKPCQHFKFDSLHYSVVDDDRYFNRDNKLFGQPCIVCGDILVHGKGEAEAVIKELQEEKEKTGAVNQELEDKATEAMQEGDEIQMHMKTVANMKKKKIAESVSSKNKGFACMNWGTGPGCKAVVCSHCWYEMDAFVSKNDKQGVAAHGRPKRMRVERRNTPPPHLQKD